jgi:ABC-type branched-subunit amino acid transport system ATPase component
MHENILEISNLSSGYFNKEIIKKINVSIKRKEIVGVVGLNGSGKSTLLKTIFGLAEAYKGNIKLNGDDITNLSTFNIIKKGIGFLPQEGPIFSELSIMQNLERAGAHSCNNNNLTLDQFIDLFPLLKRKQSVRAGLLSGGEKRALSLALALLSGRDLILLDEPSAGLSFALSNSIIELVKKMNVELGVTMIVVEQNIEVVTKICDRMLILKQGTICKEIKDHNDLSKEDINKILFE